ncbi:MAG: RNA polymerase sigma factor [Planctomycetota bacterium]|nr:MAG: RNA polymerase sigma factor [Planctomycetota bacterium]
MAEDPRNPQGAARLKAETARGADQEATTETDGRVLMEAVRGDVPGAFDDLVRRYQARVRGTVARILGDRSHADDLAQEVFLRLYRARHRYQPRARFETYLHRITFNLCLNHADSSRRRRALSLDAHRDEDGPDKLELLDPSGRLPLLDLEAGERAKLLRAALEDLPDTQRRALVLSRFENLPQVEIAKVMGLTEQAVKSLLWRARENLRRRLAPILGEDKT